MSNVQIEQAPNSPQDAEEQQATQNVRAGQAVLLLALLAATGGAWWMMQDRDAASIEPAQMASAEPAAVYDPAYDDVIVVHAGKAGDASKPAAKTVVRSRAPACATPTSRSATTSSPAPPAWARPRSPASSPPPSASS